MDQWKEHFILGEPAVGRDVAGEPDLVAWQALLDLVRTDLREAVPDPHLFVLFALERSGRGDLLEERERREVEAAAPAIRSAIEAHPSLQDVIVRIGEESAAFQAEWQAPRAEPRSSSRRGDRTLRPVVRNARTSWVWSAAAMVAAMGLIAVLVVFGRSDDAFTTITAEGDQLREVTLDDGSTVRLVAGSTIRFAHGEGENAFDRRVVLDGSAYFVVAPDASRPFEVDAGRLRTTVLGTRFGIVRRDASTDVVLASGAVQVASVSEPDRVIALSPGTMTSVSADGRPSDPKAVDVVEALDWTGLFVFRAETYGRIAQHLGNHYGVTIRVAPELASERQTGTFERDVELEEILETIERSWGFRLQGDRSSGYLLTPIQ